MCDSVNDFKTQASSVISFSRMTNSFTVLKFHAFIETLYSVLVFCNCRGSCVKYPEFIYFHVALTIVEHGG